MNGVLGHDSALVSYNGPGTTGIMRGILLGNMPLVQDRSYNLLASSRVLYNCATDAPSRYIMKFQKTALLNKTILGWVESVLMSCILVSYVNARALDRNEFTERPHLLVLKCIFTFFFFNFKTKTKLVIMQMTQVIHLKVYFVITML